jgi:glycosyltransferase involved in cell wall biosynthesis
MRGGEKVLLSLARLFPQAPIFTLIHLEGTVDAEIEGHRIESTFLQHLPGIEASYRSFLPLFPLAARTLALNEYDLVISSSHCVVKSVRTRPGAVHICYCHTPMRYVWDRYDDYFGMGRASWPVRTAMRLVAPWLRRWDRRTSGRPHLYVANSRFVAERIHRFYGRDAQVLPPPVDVDFFTPGADEPGSYDLVVSALAPYKRIDLVLDAYRDTGIRLRIVGSGPESARLRASAPPEATFLGWVDDTTLRDLYRNCRLVLLPGVEDFGIVPLEAMACGRPAIAYAEGGGLETVLPGRTGLHFHSPTAEALRRTVISFDPLAFDRMALRAHAVAHGREVFEARFRGLVEAQMRSGVS